LVPDVVQKTFRNVSRTKHEANGRWREEKGKVDQWLFTICRNAAADSLDTLDQQTLEVSLPDGLVSVVKGPFSEQEREILWDWVDNLPQGHRDVILLKYRYKMKQTDIAQRLNKSEAWVSQIHAEALALLKNRW
jgi:RNA polymerase sigma factor (sigma-70 family)